MLRHFALPVSKNRYQGLGGVFQKNYFCPSPSFLSNFVFCAKDFSWVQNLSVLSKTGEVLAAPTSVYAYIQTSLRGLRLAEVMFSTTRVFPTSRHATTRYFRHFLILSVSLLSFENPLRFFFPWSLSSFQPSCCWRPHRTSMTVGPAGFFHVRRQS